MTTLNIPIVTALIIITIGSLVSLSFFLQKRVNTQQQQPAPRNYPIRTVFNAALKAMVKPLFTLLIVYASYFSFVVLTQYMHLSTKLALIINIFNVLTIVIMVSCLFWFIARVINVITAEFYAWATRNNSRIAILIFPLINNSSKAIIGLVLINILLPYLTLPDEYLDLAEKSATILLIAAITWIILQIITVSEQYFLHHYGAQLTDNLQTRKLYTQFTLMKKIAFTLVITVALAIALMTFEPVRELGHTLLYSAGVIAAIGAFASQKTLSSTFAGLQIALTQPIKINDAVIVENEFGNVEEITLNYVVVKLWDLRRLVVPINYFIEKPFQNWTRHSSNLIGVIMLYVDYSLPVEEIRQEFNRIVEACHLWDGQVKALQVTDAREHTIELRLLVSAENAPKTFNLRCEVREKIIAYIRNNYPHCLPRVRLDNNT